MPVSVKVVRYDINGQESILDRRRNFSCRRHIKADSGVHSASSLTGTRHKATGELN